MATRSNRVLWILVLVIGCAGAASAVWWRESAHVAMPALATGTYLEPRRTLPDFTLIDHLGRRFARDNLRGGWSLLFFGYTNCPDVCPTTLATLASLEKRLRAAAGPAPPRVVFVSVDSARDTPAQLARYVPYFDPQFLGVTASTQAGIEALARELGIAVILSPRPDGSYTVDHSSAIFVVDPTARLAAILTGPFTPASLETDFARIVAGPS
jgi:protein SCO1/2